MLFSQGSTGVVLSSQRRAALRTYLRLIFRSVKWVGTVLCQLFTTYSLLRSIQLLRTSPFLGPSCYCSSWCLHCDICHGVKMQMWKNTFWSLTTSSLLEKPLFLLKSHLPDTPHASLLQHVPRIMAETTSHLSKMSWSLSWAPITCIKPPPYFPLLKEAHVSLCMWLKNTDLSYSWSLIIRGDWVCADWCPRKQIRTTLK